MMRGEFLMNAYKQRLAEWGWIPIPLLSDDSFLEDLEKRSFRFFWDEADLITGLIADQAYAQGGRSVEVASIASVGFGLTGLCIADRRGWVSHAEAYNRILMTLKFLWEKLPHERGFFYHFVHMRTGARTWDCEVSSIDTAILMAGALTARQYYPGTEVADLARKLYERVDWAWMLNGGKTLSMGWTPERGFLVARWAQFCELPMLYLLAMGSPTHPIPPEYWYAWKREPVMEYDGKTFMQCPPLFTHQFSQAWVDFRDRRDAVADYWRNSVLATQAHRHFCMHLADRFPKYGPELWGITASNSEKGYVAWGGPPATPQIDGTVVPCAAAGSIPFSPQSCLAALRHMREVYGSRIWKKYGFVDAFNPNSDWTDSNVIGIDVGITLLMAENYRSGFVWRWFMANPEIEKAMALAGFRRTSSKIHRSEERYLEKLTKDTWESLERLVDPTTALPRDRSGGEEWTSAKDLGIYLSCIPAAREMGFLSREEALTRATQVLKSLAQLPTWHGFPQNWNSASRLVPASHDTWISLTGSAVLASGLITVGQAFPELQAETRRRLTLMHWGVFYDSKLKKLRGGMDTAKKNSQADWHLFLLGSESRLANFFAIASESVPAESWEALDREMEERDHARFLKPGWKEGGMALQSLPGIWLQEKGTLMGKSAENFAWAQLEYASIRGYPVWGWSASDAPTGSYLGFGRLLSNVVTPHAAALALEYFPSAAVANLQEMEAMGGRDAKYGFQDSLDFETHAVASQQLAQDQGMMFLSLVNFLRKGVIRDWFQADPMVRKGRQLISDYRHPACSENVSVFQFQKATLSVSIPVHPKTIHARRFERERKDLDWEEMEASSNAESREEFVPRSRFAFEWDEEKLYFRMQVDDAQAINREEPVNLWKEDCVELFIDPQNDGLRWGDKADFQFGFALEDKEWEWFGARPAIQATTRLSPWGYEVNAKIPWRLLGVTPSSGMTLQVCPTVTDVDARSGLSHKTEWNWRPQGDKVALGQLVLE